MSVAASGPIWSPLQREMLEAMGLTVFREVGEAGALPDDPLLTALLRAAGRGRDAADARLLVRGWPTPQALRRDPAAKRALWPQLRALRRTPA